MATATYNDFATRHPESTAAEETVVACISDAAAEVAARCEDYGTTYDALAAKRGELLRSVECEAAYRKCGRGTVDGVSQQGLSSFSQTVGDHKWDYSYSGSALSGMLLDAEWKALGLAGQSMGWLNV